MRQVVIDAFRAWSSKFEGEVPWMYLDCKGLVTVGVGNLIDPVTAATCLPFVHADGSAASVAEIAAEWHTIKSNQQLAKQGYRVAKGFCRLHLTDDGIGTLVNNKLAANWEFMRKHYFPDCDTWPAAAQLAVSSMAWAIGAGWPTIFKNCAQSVKLGRWLDAAKECTINAAGNVGIIPRNKANIALFQYAASSADPDALP